MCADVVVSLNQQQTEIIKKFGKQRGLDGALSTMVIEAFTDYAERLIKLGRRKLLDDCVRKYGASPGFNFPASDPFDTPEVHYEQIREDIVIRPISGVAVPVYQGEVIRILQEEDGGQCVDLNAYNLTDYKEHLDAGNTRHWSGMFPRKGMAIYSNSPRDRIMFEILEMSSYCKAENVGSRCNSAQFERAFGIADHTNCQDTYQEVIGAYGLTPDDTHDSFNFWMNTGVSADGSFSLANNTGRKGDHVDLLAVFDTLCVPITCGSGDVMQTSNFSFKSIRVRVFNATESTSARARRIEAYFARLKSCRSVGDFRISKIKTERALKKDPDYVPHFRNYPIVVKPVRVHLADDAVDLLARVRNEGSVPGKDDGELVRGCALSAVLYPR